MTTLEQKLTRLINTKSDIRQKLISYGVDVPFETPFKEYANLIDQIKEVEFEETTLDQDLLQIIDLYEFLVNEEYEDYSYTAEEILQVHDLLDSINNGPIVEARPDNEEYLTMPLCGRIRYVAGENFAIDTYIIKFIHADGIIEDVTNKCTISPAGALTVNDKTVTITYENCSLTQKINVIENRPYMKLSYIESTGTQYINTGYYTNPNTEIYAEFQFTDKDTLQQRLFDVEANGATGNYVAFYINGSRKWAFSLTTGTAGTWTTTNVYANTAKHIIRLNNEKLTLDGTDYTNPGNITQISDYEMRIFANNYADAEAGQFAKAKLSAFKIYEEGVLVHDYVPCYRKSDNAIGLWDAVENVMYENAGTSSFGRGIEIWE